MMAINLNKNLLNPFSLLNDYFESFQNKVKKTKLHIDSIVLINCFKLIESKLLSDLRMLEIQKESISLENIKSIDFDEIYSYYMEFEDIFESYLHIASKKKNDDNIKIFISYINSILDTLHKISWIYQSFETKLIQSKYAS